MDDIIVKEVVSVLKKRPELFDPLKTALQIHNEHSGSFEWKGFEWYELPAQPQTLKMLVLKKILKIKKKTRTRTFYQLGDHDAVREGMELTTILMMEFADEKLQQDTVSPDLFDDVVGYEDIKQLFFRSLYAEPEDRVHFMMIGSPASAKSLFLFCLEKLPSAKYVLGSRVSRAGLAEYLITQEPRYLLVDEVDKMVGPDYAILLSLCETGRVTETLYGKTREAQLNTTVWASGNRTNGIPEEVISRFQPLHFLPYSETEFLDIVRHILTRRYVQEKLAVYIGEKVSRQLHTRDVRQALRIAKLAKNRKQVDDVIRILSRYRYTE